MSMFSSRVRKSIAVFFLVLIVQSVIAPSLSYALTAGPTAPEATSFEPVDTTDLVDLKTGDFTYGLPLLEVPGPAGGYPISLSYHAGILADVEASWTGLGFTLNPGSITRLVNGYPDDHRVIGNVTREFWEGGKTETSTVGLSMGIANGVSVSADLVFANDTYKGRGVGGSFGAGLDMGSYNIGVNGGVSPYGESYSSVGMSLGIGGAGKDEIKAQGRIGLTLNSGGKVSVMAGASVSWVDSKQGDNSGSLSLLDASISSSGTKPSLSVSGVPSTIHQQNFGRVSSVSNSWQVEIPLYAFNLRLGRSYHRAWIDETDNAWTYGSLYLGMADPAYNVAFDTYDLVDTQLDLVDHPDGEKVLGGSFPDIDNYTVTAQGLSGSIQPYHFQQELYKQNKKDKDNNVLGESYALGSRSYKKPAFNFVNDFSNRFEYEPGEFEYEVGDANTSDVMKFSFTENHTTGETGDDGYVNNHLAGSKHVDWFTNKAILGAEAGMNPSDYGFINAVAEGFIRDDNDQIGGFSITNATGVTYHYALPAYSFDEVTKMQNTTKQQQENGLYYNEVKKPEKYAHTWHLTSITGPDFVDRNENGLADNGDWGYWVRFEYKKWIGDYKWRNPGEGLNKDLDSDFDFYSGGKKELYCLTKVVTESHAAIFSTSARNDGREVVDIKSGGFDPTPIYSENPCFEPCKTDCEAQDPQGNQDCEHACKQNCPDIITGYANIPRPTFKLDEIKLYKAEDYLTNNLQDSRVLRAIKFDYDYSLAPNTPNSLDPVSYAKEGKLTLLSVHYLGKQKQELIPAVKFNYGNNPSYQKDFADMWGFYKSDYVANDNKNIAKLTTSVSAESVDAWSLTSVTSSLGSEILIDYESDEYNTPSFYKNNIVSVEGLEVNPDNHSIKLTVSPTAFDLTKVESLIKNSQLELLLRQLFKAKQYCICQGYETAAGISMGNYYISRTIYLSENNVLSITPTSVEFVDNDIYDLLTEESDGNYTETPCINLSGQQISPSVRIQKSVLASGNIVVQPNVKSYGGGLRVKEITVKAGAEESSTTYEYQNGVTTYEPVNFGKINIDLGNWPATEWSAELKRIREAREAHNKKLYKSFSSLIANAFQVPGPGVMYEQITVGQKTKTADGVAHTLPNYLVYQFETFKDGMIGFENSLVQSSKPTGPSAAKTIFKQVKTREVVLKDYTSRIGNLKSIITYSSDDTPVSSIENVYLHSDLDGSFDQNKVQYEPLLQSFVNNQGVIEQTFSRARIMLYKKDSKVPYPTEGEAEKFANDEKHLLGVIVKKEIFPSIQTKQITKNFKTGIESSTENVAFDFYSGEILSAITTDSYGNRYLSTAVPAYRKYDEMGLKVNDKHYKQMLTQMTAQTTHVLNKEGNPEGILSASIQTWGKDVPVLNAEPTPEIWRKHSTYQWNGDAALNADGSYPFDDFTLHKFNWTNPDGNSHWEKNSELTLTDIYSHALEAKDINGNLVSSRLDRSQQRVIANAANAAYNEMAYSGAEYSAGNVEKEGGVDRGQGIPSAAFAHTGKFSLVVDNGKKGFNYTLTSPKAELSKKYHASVWLYAPGNSETQAELDKVELYYVANGQEKTVHPVWQKSKSKSWYLLNIDIDPNGAGEAQVGVRNNSQRSIYFDDFRIHPLNASLTSYVYDPATGELIFILDGNNFYTKYEYDAMGRLVRVKKELLNFDFGDGKESFRADAVLKEVNYNYGRK